MLLTAGLHSTHPTLPQRGSVIDGRYLVTGLIGEGGMGAVLSAHDSYEQKRVAIKVILPRFHRDQETVRRFVTEARAISALGNPHVARLLNVGWLSGGFPYMVLEFLTGDGLGKMIQQGRTLSIPVAADLMLQACEGVADAHANGIVHRDLKPSNLFVTLDGAGRPHLKVLDFGISKVTEQDSDTLGSNTLGTELTQSNMLLGSPRYMSPEQVRCAKRVDARTDIWAIGVMLHRLLTGKLPFDADNVAEHLALVISAPPIALCAHAPEMPEELERVVARCMQAELRRRYQDVGQLAAALAPFVGTPEARARVMRITRTLSAAGAAARLAPSGEPLSTPGWRELAPIDEGLDPPHTTVRDARTSLEATTTELGHLSYPPWTVRRARTRTAGFGLVGAALALVGALALFQSFDEDAAVGARARSGLGRLPSHTAAMVSAATIQSVDRRKADTMDQTKAKAPAPARAAPARSRRRAPATPAQSTKPRQTTFGPLVPSL